MLALHRARPQVKERAIIAGRWPGHAAPRDEAIEAEEFKAYKSDVLEFITKSLDEEESVKAEKTLVSILLSFFPGLLRFAAVCDMLQSFLTSLDEEEAHQCLTARL